MRNALALRCAFVALALCTVAVSASGDPLPGEAIKFQQKPLDHLFVPGAGTFLGHDELSTANYGPSALLFQGPCMADDFADKFNQSVVHVSWWGSYLDQQKFNGVTRFLVSFETDVPAGVGGGSFSHPGAPLLTQVLQKGPLAPLSGTFTEQLVSPGGAPLNEDLYKYNAELRVPFAEQADVVYWLKIVALVDPGAEGLIKWGWHDRDYSQTDPLASTPPAVSPGERNLNTAANPVWHFQDDAVSGTVFGQISPTLTDATITQETGFAPQNYVDLLDGPQGISQFSKDLAFELYRVPEPAWATTAMLGIGLSALLRRRASRRV